MCPFSLAQLQMQEAQDGVGWIHRIHTSSMHETHLSQCTKHLQAKFTRRGPFHQLMWPLCAHLQQTSYSPLVLRLILFDELLKSGQNTCAPHYGIMMFLPRRTMPSQPSPSHPHIPLTPSFHYSTIAAIGFFPFGVSTFVASWIILWPRWVVLNVVPIEVPTCNPSGDNIVTTLRSEMAKNGNIFSDCSDFLVESQPLGQNAQLEIMDIR